ncbi:hypothetical protein [Streptomyces sp. NPDC052015]|uniref:hypothetical protein n=1 Tax=Streptomyces sp. NPDC052015 TaxID=3154755 RepID=UPI00341D2095
MPASTAAYDREDAPRALTAGELPQGAAGGLPVPDEVGEEGRGVLLLDEAQVEQQVGGLGGIVTGPLLWGAVTVAGLAAVLAAAGGLPGRQAPRRGTPGVPGRAGAVAEPPHRPHSPHRLDGHRSGRRREPLGGRA